MFLNPHDILEYVAVRAGGHVADFGTGTGMYARALLEKMNHEVTVYACDALNAHVERLHRTRVDEKLTTIFSLCVDLNTAMPFKDELLDHALVINTLHAITNRAVFLKELHRVTRMRGKVLMVDWVSSFNHMGPTPDTVIAPGDAVRMFRAHGFQIGEMLPAGTHHYAFIATKS
jgi:ubiquinone/menaquinone biosynthesis C-methylase UbiE